MIVGFASVLLFPSCTATALARVRDITPKEARELVVQALNPTQRSLPGLNLRPFQAYNVSGFYKFEVTWDPPNPGSAIVGNFGVNSATGDVWELVPCIEVHSVDLDGLQRAVRKKISVTTKELRQLGQKVPCEP
jgi:hypothetical protein